MNWGSNERALTNEQAPPGSHGTLGAFSVLSNLISTGHRRFGTNKARPGLDETWAAHRETVRLDVAKLGRLASSLRDAKPIIEGLTAKNVELCLGGSVHCPNHLIGRLLFNLLEIVRDFESDLIPAEHAKECKS